MGWYRIPLLAMMLFIATPVLSWRQYRIRRSIDLSATNPLIPDNRLPTDLVPVNYTLRLELDTDQLAFHGAVNITMTCTKQTNQINLHAHHDLQVDEENIELVQYTDNGKANTLKIRRVDRVPKKPLLVIYFHDDHRRRSV